MRACLSTFILPLVLTAACEGEGAEPPSAPAPTPSAEAKKPEAAAPVAEDPTFRLALADAGEEGLELSLEARGGYHINQDFPFSAELSSDTAKLGKTRLDKQDAATFGEEHASFTIPAELPAGEHEIVAKVRFAVCTDETCIPDRRELTLLVER